MKRKSIPKRTRFEVFKRDKFTCQYCGRSAPDVILNIDHIVAVANGGGCGIHNLITSCGDCNGGKSDVPLDKSEEIKKQKAQLDQLQERRSQLEMMANWRLGLIDMADDAVVKLSEIWTKLSGFTLSDSGRDSLKKIVRKFSFNEVADGMQAAVGSYIKTQGELSEADTAFGKIAGCCGMARIRKESPEVGDYYYIRGILRKRFESVPHYCMDVIRECHRSGKKTLDEIKGCAKRAEWWAQFVRMIGMEEPV